jgi:hypothetical protein
LVAVNVAGPSDPATKDVTFIRAVSFRNRGGYFFADAPSYTSGTNPVTAHPAGATWPMSAAGAPRSPLQMIS